MNLHRAGLARPLRPILTRLGGWPRRLLASALLLAAVATQVSGRAHAPGPAPPATMSVTVLAAARDLTAGSVLHAADLRPVRLPSAAVPAHALPAGAAVEGRRVAGPVRRGETITDVRLVGPGLTAGLTGSNSVAVPIRLADPATTALLRPGSQVDVLAGPATATATADAVADAAPPGLSRPAVLVASAVTVLAVVPVSADQAGGPLLVVAASPATARRLAGATGAGLTVVLRPS